MGCVQSSEEGLAGPTGLVGGLGLAELPADANQLRAAALQMFRTTERNGSVQPSRLHQVLEKN